MRTLGTTPGGLHTASNASSNTRAARSEKSKFKVADSLDGRTLRDLREKSDLGGMASPYTASGKSGIKHSFTLGLGDTQTTSLVCDVVTGSAHVDETKVLSLFIKVYDVGAKHAILCVVPELSPEAKKLSSMYKITTVVAPKRGEVVKRLSEVLQRIAKGNHGTGR